MSTVSSAAGRLAIIGNYLPRRCGIATFTTHLCEAIVAHQCEGACFAIPVNDRPEGYAYPGRVRFELTERDPASAMPTSLSMPTDDTTRTSARRRRATPLWTTRT